MSAFADKGYTRTAYHAGSWYSDRSSALASQLSTWLASAKPFAKISSSSDSENPSNHKHKDDRCVGVIAPHAGYSYSGPTAAWAYKNVNPENVKRVFILGPSHHVYLENCALSLANQYATPIGDLELDHSVAQELREKAPPGTFGIMSRRVDEDEHSIEMHLPYIMHVMRGHEFKIVPILVGNLNRESEEEMGKLLAPYVSSKENFFVVSSDFCHWGKRFRYMPYDSNDGEIYQHIEKLDRRGMDLIANQDIQGFNNYISETRNTICGRHPIGVMLNALHFASHDYNVTFTQYAQSSPCKSKSDSSVSYASAVITSDH
mmetsp:Transcript_4930/g.10235  ORF Transcript_4930/g.10235 Transcript_4930/m.10235 type:complete len:318 (+) Transcript_4930:150-1103(+)